jgi:hypothetical protein
MLTIRTIIFPFLDEQNITAGFVSGCFTAAKKPLKPTQTMFSLQLQQGLQVLHGSDVFLRAAGGFAGVSRGYY